jgi:hypothetical protein
LVGRRRGIGTSAGKENVGERNRNPGEPRWRRNGGRRWRRR